jgi:beta-glucosidase
MSEESFPDDFIWGAATSTYQIEGAVREAGRGESIWDVFSHTPSKVKGGETGDIACDHYHRWRDDIRLMSELGLPAYRFSIAWPRILPSGTGYINQPGLDFYDRLVEGLLETGIEPWATLFHWDLPQVLQDAGGWPARDTIQAFVEYTDVVTRRLGDRVTRWITINEPWCIAVLGYAWGVHAPGRRDFREALAAAHHLLVGHGMAIPAVRANSPGSTVGIGLNPAPIYPLTDSNEDLEAARREDGLRNRWWLDPLSGRGYPEDVAELFDGMMPAIAPDDLGAIATPTDFVSVNYYAPLYAAASPDGPLFVCYGNPPGAELSDNGWIVDPDAFTDLLVRLKTDYPWESIFILENGAAYDDPAVERSRVADQKRTRYLHNHLEAVLEAREQGVPVNGYFVWSLMDNFEWAEGYSQRFGIVHVDYQTQERTIKESGRWYARIIAETRLLSPT